MDDTRWEKLGAASGIAFAVLGGASFAFGPTDKPPGFDDAPQKVTDFVVKNADKIQLAMLLLVLASGFFLWFLGSLFRAIRIAEGTAAPRLSAVTFGAGLVTMIAEAPDRDERSNVRTLVSSALALLVVSGALVLVVSLVAARVVNWPAVFDLSPATAHEAAPAIAIFLACLALNIPLGLVTNVQNGLQEGFVANIWLAIGAVLGVSSVVVAALLEASVPVLVVAGSVPPLIALAGNALHFFGHRHPDLRPSLGSVRLSTSMALVRLGGLFFLLQIAVAVGYSSDNLIIAAIRGAPEVTAYAVPFRLFVVFPMVVALIVSPLWPAYGEAIARRDMAWVRRTLHRSLAVVAAITVPCCVLLTIAGPWIIDAWTGGRLHPSRLLLAGLALWAVVGSLGSATSMFLNAARVVRLQVVAASTMAIANVILSVVLVDKIGAAGAVWATLVSYLLFVAIPYCIRVPRLLDRLADTAGAPL